MNVTEQAYLRPALPEWADTRPEISDEEIDAAAHDCARQIDALNLADIAVEAAPLLLPLLRQGDAQAVGVAMLAAFRDLAQALGERHLGVAHPHVSDAIVAGAFALARAQKEST